MNEAALPTHLRVPSSVCVQAIGDELALLNLETGFYFGLDSQGKAFFEAITGEHSVEQAFARFCSQYDAPEEVLRGDFHEFLERLRRHGLVEGHDPED